MFKLNIKKIAILHKMSRSFARSHFNFNTEKDTINSIMSRLDNLEQKMTILEPKMLINEPKPRDKDEDLSMIDIFLVPILMCAFGIVIILCLFAFISIIAFLGSLL